MLHKVSWVLYIVGIGLILGSWLNVVSANVGWYGWLIAMAGWGMQFLPAYKGETLAQELERLSKLHSDGALTDDEYQSAKAAVLGDRLP